MPDCSAVVIRIGGPLPIDQMKALTKAIISDGAGVDYSTFTDEYDAFSYVKNAINKQKPLVLSANEQAWGRFKEVESLCQEIGLTYARHDSGHYSWDANMEIFEPGMEEPRQLHATQDEGNICLDLHFIRRLLNLGNPFFELDFLQRFQNFDLPLTLAGEWPEGRQAETLAELEPKPVDPVRAALLAALRFIDEVPEDDPEQQDKFFALRAQVHKQVSEALAQLKVIER